MTNDSPLVRAAFAEYDSLKAEQRQRISTRDNLIYLNVTMVAVLLSMTTEIKGGTPLIVVPWVGLLLGWTYIINDQKITAIRRYITTNFRTDATQDGSNQARTLFQWEQTHLSDRRATERKSIQLFIDNVAFVAPGVASAIYFQWLHCSSIALTLVAGVELALLVILGWQFTRYHRLATANQEVPE